LNVLLTDYFIVFAPYIACKRSIILQMINHFLIVFFFITLELIKSSHRLYDFFRAVLAFSEYFFCSFWDIVLVNYCFFTGLSAEQLLSLHLYMGIVRFRSWYMIFLKVRPILFYLCLLDTSLASKPILFLFIRFIILIKRYIISLWKTCPFFFEDWRRWKALLLSHMRNMMRISLFGFVSTLYEII
jgi:hypothetical protein